MPTGSKKANRPGILLERRWLSSVFTAPKIAALNNAVLIQLNRFFLSPGNTHS